MRRALSGAVLPLLCGLVLLGLWVVPARGTQVQPQHVESGSLIVTAETAEVREGPSPSHEVITLVGKGEIFAKQGRTGAWYCIKVSDETFGWVNGRTVRSYREGAAEGSTSPYAEGSTPPYVAPEDPRYYPYYPGGYGYYDYSYSYWDRPYLSWEWYIYDRDSHRDRTRVRHRDRDDGRFRDDNRHRRDDVHRRDDSGHRSNPRSRPHAPRIRLPFPRR